MLTETHHRIKNHLQLISSMLNLQSNSLDNEVARGALRSSQNRVRAIAALHQHLYQLALGRSVPLKDFVDELVSRLRACYDVSADRVKVLLELDDMQVHDEWVLPVALILNEAVSNAFKHAFPGDRHGNIRISFHESHEQVHLQVMDDGCGLPEGFDPAQSLGLGMKVIGVFAEQMNGKTSLENITDSGVVFNLHFPITCVDN